MTFWQATIWHITTSSQRSILLLLRFFSVLPPSRYFWHGLMQPLPPPHPNVITTSPPSGKQRFNLFSFFSAFPYCTCIYSIFLHFFALSIFISYFRFFKFRPFYNKKSLKHSKNQKKKQLYLIDHVTISIFVNFVIFLL